MGIIIQGFGLDKKYYFSEQNFENFHCRWGCGETGKRQPGAAVMTHKFYFLQTQNTYMEPVQQETKGKE